MASPRKIHEWLLKALEEPFFRAEMHRVEMLLKNKPEKKKDLRQSRCLKSKTADEENARPDSTEKDSPFTTLSGKIFSR
ncbi:MAG: hypothetical protein K6U04_07695 [Armatimonadetes bacterium]|nr:hypothetical protein [Armatimonadota bacterium]